MGTARLETDGRDGEGDDQNHYQHQQQDVPSSKIEEKGQEEQATGRGTASAPGQSRRRPRPGRRCLDFSKLHYVDHSIVGTASSGLSGSCTSRLAHASSSSPGTTEAPVHPPVVVGRQRQMNLLLELYRKASMECHPSAIVLIAKSGTGKTSFLNAFIYQLHQQQEQMLKEVEVVVDDDGRYTDESEKDNLASSTESFRPEVRYRRPLVGFGKFEERTAASEPFEAIVEVVDSIIQGLLINAEADVDEDGSNVAATTAPLRREGTAESTVSETTADAKFDNIGDDGDDLLVLRRRQRRTWRHRFMETLEHDELTILKSHLPSFEKLITLAGEEGDNVDVHWEHHDYHHLYYHHHHHQNHYQLQDRRQKEQVISEESDFPNFSTRIRMNNEDAEDDGYGDDDNDSPFGDMSAKEYRFERFRLALRELIRCICRVSPLVIILDDLHFADRDSVALIKTIVDDTTQSKELKLLFVGASRPVGDDIASTMNNSDENIALDDGAGTKSVVGSTRSSSVKLREVAAPIMSLLSGRTVTTSQASQEYNDIIESSSCSGIREIELPGLSVFDVEAMLYQLFGIDHSCQAGEESSCDDMYYKLLSVLADVVHQKTGGNAFVAVHFLRHLEQRELLYYDEASESWKWQIHQIVNGTESPQSVGAAIVGNLWALDDRQRQVLITAACFGLSHFELSTIVHAMGVVNHHMRLHEGDEDGGQDMEEGKRLSTRGDEADYTDHFTIRNDMESAKILLDASVINGFVEETSPGHFKFTHDRIREAAYSLLPSGIARKQVHLRIARHLRLWMDTEEEYGTCLSSDSILLHAAKQYNYGADLITDLWERLDVAELNFHAAEVAARKASFATSSEYLQNGLSVLGPDAWTNHYDLALKLSTAYTKTQFSCGDFVACIESADEVIQFGKEWSHKRDVYNIKMLCLFQQKRIDEGLQLGRFIMEMLGHPIPTRFLSLHVLWNHWKGSKFFKNVTDDQIRNLPAIDDKTYVDAMKVLFRMLEFSFYGVPEIYFDTYAVRSFVAVKELGTHPTITPYAVALWGFKLMEEGKFSEASRFGKLSVELAEKQCTGKLRGMRARIYVISYYFLSGWNEDIISSLEPMSKHLADMCASDALDMYHQDINTYLRQSFVAGVPLEKLSVTCDEVLEALKDYSQHLFWNTSAPISQAVLNFMGRSEDPTVLAGAYIDHRASVEVWEDSNKTVLNQYYLFTMIVKYHFGDYKGANDARANLNKSLWGDGPEFLVTSRVFYTSLVNIQMFRLTNKRKYRYRAMKSLKQILRWVQNGASNCMYQKLLIDAECASLNAYRHGIPTGVSSSDDVEHSRVSDIVLLYNKAIDAASSAGVRHHEALSNELACNFLVACGLKRRASRYFSRSLALYRNWQAYGKVDHMVRQHADLCELIVDKELADHGKGLKRFDKSSSTEIFE